MGCSHVADERIMERYLTGQLDNADRESFEQHFFDCEECFAELEMLQAAQRVLSAEPISSELEVEDEHPRWLKTWGGPLAAAAVLVISLFSVLWLMMRPPLPQAVSLSPELAELARIEPPSYEPFRLRGAQDEAQQRFRTAMEFYSVRDYVSAIPGLEEAANLDPSAPNISFFLGACYLFVDRTSEGIESLQHTVNLGDTPYLEEALMLTAKAHLQSNNRDAAARDLRRVLELEGDLQAEARALLKKSAPGFDDLR